MRLDIVNLCARSPTMLATITQIRQAPRLVDIVPHDWAQIARLTRRVEEADGE